MSSPIAVVLVHQCLPLLIREVLQTGEVGRRPRAYRSGTWVRHACERYRLRLLRRLGQSQDGVCTKPARQYQLHGQVFGDSGVLNHPHSNHSRANRLADKEVVESLSLPADR